MRNLADEYPLFVRLSTANVTHQVFSLTTFFYFYKTKQENKTQKSQERKESNSTHWLTMPHLVECKSMTPHWKRHWFHLWRSNNKNNGVSDRTFDPSGKRHLAHDHRKPKQGKQECRLDWWRWVKMCFSMKDSQLCLNISIINSLFHYKLRTELPKSNQCVNKTSCVQNLGTYYSS